MDLQHAWEYLLSLISEKTLILPQHVLHIMVLSFHSYGIFHFLGKFSSTENVDLNPYRSQVEPISYRAFHRFGQAKFPDGGSILGSSQYSKLPQLPPKLLLNSKVVKIDPKIIISIL